MFKKYFIPLLLILCLSFLVPLLETYLYGELFRVLFIIIRASILFALGVNFNYHHRSKNQSWFKKVVISFLVVFFVLSQIGVIFVSGLNEFFNIIGFNGYIIYFLYIYFGWGFFD